MQETEEILSQDNTSVAAHVEGVWSNRILVNEETGITTVRLPFYDRTCGYALDKTKPARVCRAKTCCATACA